MILSGKLFKIQYAVGGAVYWSVVGGVHDMRSADVEVLLHVAAQPGYAGEQVQILAATEIDLETL